MPGIGESLRTERLRQGRTLADAAAETRVRESYLAAIETEDFDVLGGDVYARGFIRLYGKYLGLDADALVDVFRREHERPEEITAIPGATIDDFMPSGRPRLVLSPPVLAAAGIVGVLVLLFLVFRGGGEDPADVLDPNAPGPSPAAAATDPLADAAAQSPAPGGTAAAVAPAPAPPAAEVAGAEVLTEVVIVVTAVQPVRLTVDRGQPPVSATLEPGESRTLTDPAGEQVVFTVSDFSAAEITVNGGPLQEPSLAGQVVQITCTVGEAGCNALPL
jgi:cytoskeleton protein RodZ